VQSVDRWIGAVQLSGPQHTLLGRGAFKLNVTPRSSPLRAKASALVHVERGTNHVTFFHLLAVLTVGLAVVVRVARGGTVVGPALGGVVLANVCIQLLMSLAHTDHDVGRALLQDDFPAPHRS
jgi:hypothetical protein